MTRVVVAACIVSLLVASGAAGADTTAKQTVFRDVVAENAAGPDVRLVTVSSDESVLTFRVDVPTHPVLTDDMRVRIWLDSDDDRATGLAVEGLEGFDYQLMVDRWELGYGAVGFFRCIGSTCSGGRPDAENSVRFTYANGATFRIDARDLGIRHLERVSFSVTVTAGVEFDPVSRTYDLANARIDRAPEPGALWTYDARVLRVTSFSATPEQPRAGERHFMRLGVVRTDTGAIVRKGRVSCSARVQGTLVPVRTRQFVDGRAVCAFAIPAGSSGERFRSTIGIAFGGAEIKRSLSGRIG